MKIAFSGTHGTGKTTSVFELATKFKKDNTDKTVGIIAETARRCPLPINKDSTEMSQLWIFAEQMKFEIEYCEWYDIVICDRSIIDSIAYTYVGGYYELANRKLETAKSFMNTYDKIIFKTIKSNNYIYDDGIRDSKDLDYRKKIEDKMLELYQKLLKDYDFEFEVI